jgi:hypothetical protein
VGGIDMDEGLKLLNLLFLYGRPGLTQEDLDRAGAGCQNRAVVGLEARGAIFRDPDSGQYRLGEAAAGLMQTFTLVPALSRATHLRIDYPEAFVAMPYAESYKRVYDDLIEPGVRDAGLHCNRADERARVGSLEEGLWRGILSAGIIIAEVSTPNVNVFYELGAARAVGKDILLLKQRDSDVLPADVQGMLYCEYELGRPGDAKARLTAQLKEWAANAHADNVKRLDPLDEFRRQALPHEARDVLRQTDDQRTLASGQIGPSAGPQWQFNPPPGWPPAPPGFVPPQGWQPDPSWPAAPEGWQWWTPNS